MTKYIYIILVILSMVAVIAMLIWIGHDLYIAVNPSGVPTSIYTSHATALKFFILAALCVVVGLIIRLLKV